MVVDVERFGDSSRTNLDQLTVRDGLYKALGGAFRKSRIGWADCVTEDRGDGVLVLIPPEVPKSRLVTRYPAALAAAIGKHNARCPEPARMRLRVALHAGEIHRDEHGVAGAAINHAFRLVEAPVLKSALGTSPGGVAVMVSGWFFDEVVRHDPAADPGSYWQVQVAVKETQTVAWIRLPDTAMEEPVRAGWMRITPSPTAYTWRATRELASGGAHVVDPLGSLPGTIGIATSSGGGRPRWPEPAQLPHDTGGFTGREPELATLEALAASDKGTAVVISAIDGTAGIGKTALAVHFGHRVAAQFPDGQLYVNLRGFDPSQPPLAPDAVLTGFMRALGADPSQIPSDVDELAGLYRSLLATRRVLIVLDNAATADQVRPLLPAAPTCLVLVTSRNRLSGLVARDGAHRLTLDILTPAEAVTLLARVAGTERVAADPAAAAQLAQLCGRLPLALRIAADRAAAHPHLTLVDLADELTGEHDRLDVLNAEEEITQLRAVFSWSYDALSAEPARAFRLLGLHPGTDITTPAAAALIGATHPQARQLLTTLSSGHLLEETGRDQYRFHDLVRVYAAECAQAHEPETQRTAAICRLLTWYLHTADAFFRTFNPDATHVPLDPPEPACKPLTFATHHQALQWAQAEITNLVPTVRQADASGEHTLTWKLAATLGPVFIIQARLADWRTTLHLALTAAQHLGDRNAEAWTLDRLGEAYTYSDRPDKAISFSQRALAIAAETGNLNAQWGPWHSQGLAFLDLKRFGDAAECFQEALTVARRTSNRRNEGLSLTFLGVAYQHLERHDAAIALHQRALTVLSQTRNKWQQGLAAAHLARAHHSQGSIDKAIGYYRQAQAILREIGDRRSEAGVLADIGDVQEDVGNLDAARQTWRQALASFEDLGDPQADQIRARLNTLSAGTQ